MNISQVQREDFQPKQISTIQTQTGPSGTKSPQVAVIPPLVDLTKLPAESRDEESPQDEKGQNS